MKENNDEPSFAEEAKLVRAFRESKGWTQIQLAEALETSVNTLSKIENGKRRLSGHIIKRLGKSGMNFDDLTYLSKQDNPGQSFAYRLSEVENRLATMEKTLTKILALLNEKE